jgi:hypothetical protein
MGIRRGRQEVFWGFLGKIEIGLGDLIWGALGVLLVSSKGNNFKLEGLRKNLFKIEFRNLY